MSFLLFLLLETSDGDSLHFAAQETTPYTRLDARATVVFGVFLFPFGLFTTVPLVPRARWALARLICPSQFRVDALAMT